ncbi:Copia protein [Leucoagaricus sp. SymC.cos]|nr:Copia protein [Leucoagaricus sp. SymC.cos]
MGGGPVMWATRRQESTATSTTEAEYMALARAVQQAMWLSSFMDKIILPQPRLMIIFVDNQGAIDLTRTYRGHKRTKHIAVKYHFVKEKAEEGEFTPIYIKSKNNIADIFTKILPWDATRRKVEEMGLTE